MHTHWTWTITLFIVYIFKFSHSCYFVYRSILTVPWIELGGKTTINCPKTGFSCNIDFHTKVLLNKSVSKNVPRFPASLFNTQLLLLPYFVFPQCNFSLLQSHPLMFFYAKFFISYWILAKHLQILDVWTLISLPIIVIYSANKTTIMVLSAWGLSHHLKFKWLDKPPCLDRQCNVW